MGNIKYLWLTVLIMISVYTQETNSSITEPAVSNVSAQAAQENKPKKKKIKRKDRIRFYGFIQVFYRYAFETGINGIVDNDNFRVQRVRLGVKGKVLPKVRYAFEIDPRAPLLKGVLRDAYIELRFIPKHKIRIGQQKTQFGYESRTSSTELFAVNRTEVTDSYAGGLNQRDIGLGLIGHIPIGEKGWRFEDAITVVNGAGMNVQDDNTAFFNTSGRLGIGYKKDGNWGSLGASGFFGDFMDEGDDEIDPADDYKVKARRVGFDLEMKFKYLFISGEYILGFDEELGELEDGMGGYLNLVGLTPIKIGPIFRVDAFSDEFFRWTFGAYYGNPTDRFRIMINYELRQVFEDDFDNLGRGDDKLYIWTQANF